MRFSSPADTIQNSLTQSREIIQSARPLLRRLHFPLDLLDSEEPHESDQGWEEEHDEAEDRRPDCDPAN